MADLLIFVLFLGMLASLLTLQGLKATRYKREQVKFQPIKSQHSGSPEPEKRI